MATWLENLKVGDSVVRMLAGVIPMELKVIAIKPDRLVCGGPEFSGADWEFDLVMGFEIDEDLGWGRQADGKIVTGSYLQEKKAA